MSPPWLEIARGDAPLIVSLPHTGLDLDAIEPRFASPWLARKDADWHVERLYEFAGDLGATIVRTTISRAVVDVNRDPSGASLYPGQATTQLCPLTTFDGEPLYRDGEEPTTSEIAERRATFFDPYHRALRDEVARLREIHHRIVLYDCHSIRSAIPRLFEGELPVFNLGTNGGLSADPALSRLVEAALAADSRSFVVNGRFRGGWITRSFGDPTRGVHAVQMELACRGYMREPRDVAPGNWPSPYDEILAAPMRRTLTAVLGAALDWAAA